MPARREQGWLRQGVKAILRGLVRPDMAVIVELGAWLGLSTRFLADLAPRAAIVAVDHWRGSSEHQTKPECRELLPVLGGWPLGDLGN